MMPRHTMPRLGSLRYALERTAPALLVLGSALAARAQEAVPRTVEEQVDPLVGEKLRRVDRDEEWSSEGDVARAQEQLERLGSLWLTEPVREPAVWRPYLTKDFTATPLRPSELATVFDDATVRVLRGADDGPGEAREIRTVEGLAVALGRLGEPLVGGHGRWMSWKTVAYLQRAGGFETRVRWTAFAETSAHRVQLDGTWRCSWDLEVEASLPRLSALEVR